MASGGGPSVLQQGTRWEGTGDEGEQGRINREDIRRHSPAALDEICQTSRRASICSVAYLRHDERAVGGFENLSVNV